MSEDGSTHKLVIVVRRDLKLSPGKMAAQVAHAAVDCALRAKSQDARNYSKWYQQGQKKVVVGVPDLVSLHEVRMAAERAGLASCLISDAGHTEIEPGTVTCVGVGPASNAIVDSVTGKLPLL